MDEFMKTIIRRLRSERCPERVLEKVRRAVAGDRAPAVGLGRIRLGLGAATVLLVLSATLFLLKPGPKLDLTQAPLPRSQPPEGTTSRQIYASLGSMGMVLQEAGNRSGTIIFQETFPLLRQGLETTKNAITPKNKP